MIRKIAMAILMMAVVAVPAAAHAQTLKPKNIKVTFVPAAAAPTTTRVDFTRIAPVVAATKAAPAQSTGKKNFWKTPGPYAIIVGAAAVVVVAVKSGGAGGY